MVLSAVNPLPTVSQGGEPGSAACCFGAGPVNAVEPWIHRVRLPKTITYRFHCGVNRDEFVPLVNLEGPFHHREGSGALAIFAVIVLLHLKLPPISGLPCGVAFGAVHVSVRQHTRPEGTCSVYNNVVHSYLLGLSKGWGFYASPWAVKACAAC